MRECACVGEGNDGFCFRFHHCVCGIWCLYNILTAIVGFHITMYRCVCFHLLFSVCFCFVDEMYINIYDFLFVLFS